MKPQVNKFVKGLEPKKMSFGGRVNLPASVLRSKRRTRKEMPCVQCSNVFISPHQNPLAVSCYYDCLMHMIIYVQSKLRMISEPRTPIKSHYSITHAVYFQSHVLFTDSSRGISAVIRFLHVRQT